MKDKSKIKPSIKLQTNIHAGFWIAFGVGLGGLQITEKPPEVSSPVQTPIK
jgi:hypothetical protein